MDDATAENFAANQAAERPIDDGQFHDLVRARSRPLLELARRLTAMSGGELALTRPSVVACCWNRERWKNCWTSTAPAITAAGAGSVP